MPKILSQRNRKFSPAREHPLPPNSSSRTPSPFPSPSLGSHSGPHRREKPLYSDSPTDLVPAGQRCSEGVTASPGAPSRFLLLKAMPALLTSTSSPPYSLRRKSRTARMLCRSSMSSWWKRGLRPSACSCCTAARPRASSRAVSTTSPLNCRHRSRTMARPMPLLAPVTSATRVEDDMAGVQGVEVPSVRSCASWRLREMHCAERSQAGPTPGAPGLSAQAQTQAPPQGAGLYPAFPAVKGL